MAPLYFNSRKRSTGQELSAHLADTDNLRLKCSLPITGAHDCKTRTRRILDYTEDHSTTLPVPGTTWIEYMTLMQNRIRKQNKFGREETKHK